VVHRTTSNPLVTFPCRRSPSVLPLPGLAWDAQGGLGFSQQVPSAGTYKPSWCPRTWGERGVCPGRGCAHWPFPSLVPSLPLHPRSIRASLSVPRRRSAVRASSAEPGIFYNLPIPPSPPSSRFPSFPNIYIRSSSFPGTCFLHQLVSTSEISIEGYFHSVPTRITTTTTTTITT
jgi:hypothetical protein